MRACLYKKTSKQKQKKNQADVVEFKNAVDILKNASVSLTSNTNQTEERISEPEDRLFENMLSEETKA